MARSVFLLLDLSLSIQFTPDNKKKKNEIENSNQTKNS